MKNLYFRFILTTLLFWLTLGASAAGTRLFHVLRSLNSNIVCYDIQLTGSGLNMQKPIKVYWINNETKPARTKELNAVERKMAFGYKVISASVSTAKVALAAYPGRPITVTKRGNTWVALININGKECVLTEIYVKSKGTMSVEYLELRGKATVGGAVMKEKLKP